MYFKNIIIKSVFYMYIFTQEISAFENSGVNIDCENIFKNENSNKIYLERTKRHLTFPNATLFQVNFGVGVPVPLKFKKININLIFQANFAMPWNITQFPEEVLFGPYTSTITDTARKKRENTDDNLVNAEGKTKITNGAIMNVTHTSENTDGHVINVTHASKNTDGHVLNVTHASKSTDGHVLNVTHTSKNTDGHVMNVTDKRQLEHDNIINVRDKRSNTDDNIKSMIENIQREKVIETTANNIEKRDTSNSLTENKRFAMKTNNWQDNESYLRIVDIYKVLEEHFDSYGYNGSDCILKTICQLGAQPLHTEYEDDVLHDIMQLLMRPTHMLDIDTPISSGAVTGDPILQRYVEAQISGEENQNCDNLFPYCSLSPADFFTRTFYDT